jgi:hypothetical protein
MFTGKNRWIEDVAETLPRRCPHPGRLEKTMSRALKRHHSQRMKQRRSHYWGNAAAGGARRIGIVATTPKPCSCWMCRNRRRDEGPTLQELRNGLRLEDGI